MIKKFSKLLVVLTILSLAVCAFCVSASASDYVYTINNGTYLKAHPDNSADDNTYVPAGAQVNYLDSRDGWYQVGYQGYNGWTPSSNVSVTSTSAIGTTSSWRTDGYNTYTTAALNLRSQPSNSSTIIMVVPSGASVYLHSHGNGWAYIYYNGTPGYVVTNYLAAFNGGSGSSSSGQSSGSINNNTAYNVNTYTTTTAAVNLRSGASTAYASMAVIPANTQVYLLSYSNGWSLVQVNGMQGYVYNNYLNYFYSQNSSSGSSSGSIVGSLSKPTSSGWYDTGINAVTTASVNLRTGPGTNYSSQTVIPAGSTVYIASYNPTANWAYVYYGSQLVGYVCLSYLSY